MSKLIIVLAMLMSGLLLADFTIVESYPLPDNAYCAASDEEGNLFINTYDETGVSVLQFNPADSSAVLVFTSMITNASDMTWDGNRNCFWMIDQSENPNEPALAKAFNMQGDQIHCHEQPDHFMSGITCEGAIFYILTYDNPDGYVYEKEINYECITNEFELPANQPCGVCIANNYLWITDVDENLIFKVSRYDGTVMDSFPSLGSNPTGITFDGEYIWYIDKDIYGECWLHKVDLGQLIPIAEFSSESYDYGNVIINQSAYASIEITNTGDAPLIFSQIYSDSDSPLGMDISDWYLPPGYTGSIQFSLLLGHLGEYSSNVFLESNDSQCPSRTFPLTAYGLNLTQDIDCTPVIEFSDVRATSLTSRKLRISNQGIDNLTIYNIELSNDVVSLEYNEPFPISISTRDTLDVRLWLNTNDATEPTCDIYVFSNDIDEPIVTIPIEISIIPFDDEIGSQYWSFLANGSGEAITALMKFIDLNGDGKSEVVVSDSDHHLYCLNGNGSDQADVIWSINFEDYGYGGGSIVHERNLIIVDDVNQDGIDDIGVGTDRPNCAVYILDGRTGNMIWSHYSSEFSMFSFPVGSLDSRRDFNGDGCKDVLAVWYDNLPDCNIPIVLYDGITGSPIWMSESDFYATKQAISISDQNNDEIPDVVAIRSLYNYSELCVISGENGVVLETYSSQHELGNLIELKDVSGEGLNDFMFTISNTDFASIFAMRCDLGTLWDYFIVQSAVTGLEKATEAGSEYIIPVLSTSDEGIVLNASSGEEMISYPLSGETFVSSPIRDINGDGHFDILNGNSDHQIQAYSGSNGFLIWDDTMDALVLKAIDISDLDSNNSNEMLLGLCNGTIVCLSGGINASAPMASVQLNVTTNSEDDPIGAEYLLIGPDSFSGEIPSGGSVLIDNVPLGTYNLLVTKSQYDDILIENLIVEEDIIEDLLLIETISPVENFRAQLDGGNLILLWGNARTRANKDNREDMLSRDRLSTRIYLNEEIYAELDADQQQLVIEDIAGGTYHFAATYLYNTGESDPTEIEVVVVGNDPGFVTYNTTLYSNSPNPFNPTTTIQFSLKDDTFVSLKIYNTRGQLVKTLVNEDRLAGEQAPIVWNGTDENGNNCGSGVYFYKLETNNKTITRKMMMIK